jgi:hypothetical protein
LCWWDEGVIYMVRKSSHGGVAYPVHVQKCVRPLSDVNGKQTPFCENNSCRVYMEVAWEVEWMPSSVSTLGK